MENHYSKTQQVSSSRNFFRKNSAATLCFMLMSLLAKAQWSADATINTPVCTAANDQTEQAIVASTLGSSIITWVDQRSGDENIYAQKLDSNGVAQWTANGVAICTALDYQAAPMLVSDGLGGAIIVWQDNRNGINTRLFAQGINANGTVQWVVDGIALSAAITGIPQIISDGAGGAIVVWESLTSVIGSDDIYAQRINKNGTIAWAVNGAPICVNSVHQTDPMVTSDGALGAIISWTNGSDIYAQRINANGVIQWAQNGKVVNNFIGSQVNQGVMADGSGGAIVIWYEYVNGFTPSIKAQKINSAGLKQWSSNGVSVFSATAANNYLYENIQIVSDYLGGAIIGWMEENPNVSIHETEIYTQRISSSGLALWQTNGINLNGTNIYNSNLKMKTDNIGGAIFAWQGESTYKQGIVAQHLNLNGTVLWGSNGTLVASNPYVVALNGPGPNPIAASAGKFSPDLTSDGAGGAVVVWFDERAVNRDVYAQNIRDNGALGGVCVFPSMPVISASADTICKNEKVTLTITSGTLNDAVNWYWYRDLCGGYINPTDSTNAYFLGTGASISLAAVGAYSSTYYVRGEGNCVVPGNCTSITIKVVNLNIPKAQITGNLAFCDGATTDLTTGTYTSYLWSNGATTQNITLAIGGTYSVTVMNDYGCHAMDTVIVVKNSKPTVTVTPTSSNICPPQTSTTLTAGTNAATYSWSPALGLNQTTGSVVVAAPLVTSKYTVTGTSSAGCTATATSNVTVAPIPVNVTVTNITASGAKINWTLVNCAVGYQVAYKLATATTWTIKNISTNVAFANLTGLLASSNYQCKVRTKFPNGTYSVYSVTKSFTTPAARLGETATVNALQVYPNPASDKLNLEFPFTEGDATITVVNALGQTVLTQKNNDAEVSIELNIQSLTEGLYFVTVKNGDNTFNSRFVKK